MKLLCTDLDRTLLPNGEQDESAHARPILWHLLSVHSIALAYVSGRDLRLVLDAISEHQLPTPDVIVADVGASIYTQFEGVWRKNAEWELRLDNEWQGRHSADVHNALSSIFEMRQQESSRQSRFKQSYYYSESLDDAVLSNVVEAKLARHGLYSSLVFSHDPVKNTGLLDIVPLSANKRDAIVFVSKLLKIDNHDVLFSGDSGNDVQAICALTPSVLVANADAQTSSEVVKLCQLTEISACTYLAKGDLEVASQQPLNGNYAAGIVEGIMHFRPHWRDDLGNAHWVEQAMTTELEQGRVLRFAG